MNTTRARLNSKTRDRAFRALAKAHPAEYRRLLDQERETIGMPAVGAHAGSPPADLPLGEMRAAYDAGASFARLGTRYGVSAITVWRHFRRAGLATRPRGYNKRSAA